MCADVCIHDTGGGNINREIEVSNQTLRQIKARIAKLQNWLAEEIANTEPPTLADVIEGILSRRKQSGNSGRYQTIGNLKAAANLLNFLTADGIKDMAGLTEHLTNLYGKQFHIRDKLKPIERRLTVLDEHIKQADIYRQLKGKKPRNEAEEILFAAAKKYITDHLNGHGKIPYPTWTAERTKLIAERKTLNREYLSLKAEVKEVEQIRRSVDGILRQEQREQQPRRAQDMEL